MDRQRVADGGMEEETRTPILKPWGPGAQGPFLQAPHVRKSTRPELQEQGHGHGLA